jgi:uncharacterized membrane protein (GlpM family)
MRMWHIVLMDDNINHFTNPTHPLPGRQPNILDVAWLRVGDRRIEQRRLMCDFTQLEMLAIITYLNYIHIRYTYIETIKYNVALL